MDCLRCSVCSSTYTDSKNQMRLPRVLILCGHTFCQTCIEKNLINEKIACFECQKISSGMSINQFPINQTLISVLKSTIKPQQHLCRTHNKKLQAYCQKQKELICVQCSLTNHRFHKASMISAKAQLDRSILKQSLQKILESYHDSKKVIEKLNNDEASIQSSFLDQLMQISIFYKNIIQTITSLQQKQEDRLKKQKQEFLKKINQYRNEALQKQAFHEKLQQIYNQLCQVSDIEFLKRQNQQLFIINNCKIKKQKYLLHQFEFKKVNCLQEIINNLQEISNFEKKRIIHSNSVYIPSKDAQMIHGSPSLKKQGKQPAVLEVNLSEQYNKRKSNYTKDNAKKIKPTKKIINITTDKQRQKQRIIQAVSSGRTQNIPQKEGKITDLKYIRQSSIKKHKQSQSFFFDELDNSQNLVPLSVNSFMRSSRQSQPSFYNHNNQSSIKNSFNSFSLLDMEQKIYHFGGRAQSMIQKYSKQGNKSQKMNIQLNRKAMQVVYHRSYSFQKCLILGGITNNSNEIDNSIYEFNFKTQKVVNTSLNLNHFRANFGCISKNQYIYLLGGKNEKPLNTFEQIEIKNNGLQVTKMPNMIQARQDLGSCLGFDGFIYAAGGVNHSNNILNSCERYNWQKRGWESVPHMKYQRRGFTMIAVPHGIFAIGGHSSLKVLASIQIFDFNKQQWIELSSMNEARCYHSAVLSKDYQTITVFGGFVDKNELDSIQIYEIDNNRWINGGKMKQKRCLHSSIISPM